MWDCWHSVFLVMHRQGGLVKINNQNRKIFFGFKRLFFLNNSILIARQFYRYFQDTYSQIWVGDASKTSNQSKASQQLSLTFINY